MKFNLNDRVVIKSQAEADPTYYPYTVGTVIAYVDDDTHIVEFTYGNCSKVKPEYLVSEEEAKEIRAAVQAKRDKLEKEFGTVRKRIGEKLTQAAELIRESRKLASEHHKDLERLREADDLYDVMCDIGWISSSSC